MQTIIDPREARRFADALTERAQEVRQLDSAVSRRLLELHANSWQDARYSQFERRYEEASLLLQLFVGHAEKYADYLRRKAAPVDRYLGRGY
jgi:hypothetical protein